MEQRLLYLKQKRIYWVNDLRIYWVNWVIDIRLPQNNNVCNTLYSDLLNTQYGTMISGCLACFRFHGHFIALLPGSMEPPLRGEWERESTYHRDSGNLNVKKISELKYETSGWYKQRKWYWEELKGKDIGEVIGKDKCKRVKAHSAGYKFGGWQDMFGWGAGARGGRGVSRLTICLVQWLSQRKVSKREDR